MLAPMLSLVDELRRRRWANLFVVNLRILLGFAFVPAGLKKVLREPFTDPANSGPFHDFLDAFFATGIFYPFVGAVQLVIAVLLMTQTFAALGAGLALPVITAILVFCWSTSVVPTAIVVTMMFLGTVGLVLWDYRRWIALLRPATSSPLLSTTSARDVPPPDQPPIDLGLWRICGAGILVYYGLSCIAYGGVFRPKGLDVDNPWFYVLPLLMLFPTVTLIVESRRRRAFGS